MSGTHLTYDLNEAADSSTIKPFQPGKIARYEALHPIEPVILTRLQNDQLCVWNASPGKDLALRSNNFIEKFSFSLE